jgi:hypothetical protein
MTTGRRSLVFPPQSFDKLIQGAISMDQNLQIRMDKVAEPIGVDVALDICDDAHEQLRYRLVCLGHEITMYAYLEFESKFKALNEEEDAVLDLINAILYIQRAIYSNRM